VLLGNIATRPVSILTFNAAKNYQCKYCYNGQGLGNEYRLKSADIWQYELDFLEEESQIPTTLCPPKVGTFKL